ncbi:hypothetical protein CR513_50275, partial [Mucuna pruriens]
MEDSLDLEVNNLQFFASCGWKMDGQRFKKTRASLAYKLKRDASEKVNNRRRVRREGAFEDVVKNESGACVDAVLEMLEATTQRPLLSSASRTFNVNQGKGVDRSAHDKGGSAMPELS